MQEIILIFACINGTGCSNTAQNYRYYNKEAVSKYENTAYEASKKVPRVLIGYVAPVIGYYAGQTTVINVYKHINMEVTSENISVKFNYSY